MILILNDLVDMLPQYLNQMDGEARGSFRSLLEFLEKNIRININSISQQTLADTIYYFCKFRVGSPEFWTLLEGQLAKNVESMTGPMLCKQLLALVMNSRPAPEQLARQIVDQILSKMDKVEGRDIFFVCIALGKGQRRLPVDLLSADFYYAIYLKLVSTMS